MSIPDFATIDAMLAHQAGLRPDATFAIATESGHEVSYAQLRSAAADVSRMLRGMGLAPGDTISLVMPNGIATLNLLIGAMAGGWCVNPVNLLSQPEQMRYVLEHSDCKAVFAAPDWMERIRQLAADIGRDIAVVEADPDTFAAAGGAPQPVDHTPSIPDAVALLMYTSGTTGRPKGVMLTQANVCANAVSIAREHRLGPGDRVLGVLPLYHINAFAVTMLAPLASGGSVAMAPRFSATRFWSQTVESGCTWINVVPTIISYLLEAEAPDPVVTRRIRFCRSASAALPPEHLRAFEAKFGIGIIETMGLTETVAPLFSNPLEPSLRKTGSVGRASGCEARIVDATFNTVADGTTGELAIRGPNVMRGYFKNPAATAESFTPDGWLRTGDLGHRDADGFFFVTGRIKELIIKGGENIAPREIDEALLKHPAVLDAAAVGVPDRHYGQDILACIVLREGLDCGEDALREFCKTHLGHYKTPRVFRFVKELPRGPSGKVQRLKLADLFAAAAASLSAD